MKKKSILFIQGGGKGAFKADMKLVSFLKKNMKESYEIHYPQMPDENNPSYENYKGKIQDELKNLDGEIILIGHSLGSCFLLKYLSEEKINFKISGILLIATPFWGGAGWQYEGFRLNKDFASTLPSKTPIFLYHSTNDEIVPFKHLALYTKEIPDALVRKIDARGHQLGNDLSEVIQDLEYLDNK